METAIIIAGLIVGVGHIISAYSLHRTLITIERMRKNDAWEMRAADIAYHKANNK